MRVNCRDLSDLYIPTVWYGFIHMGKPELISTYMDPEMDPASR